jgi:hypothetical protein
MKNLFKTKKISLVCFLETLCDRAFPMPDFDSEDQNSYRNPSFMQEAKKNIYI